MMDNSRSRRTGNTYFFTVRTARQGSDLLLGRVDVLRSAMRQTRARYPFEIEEIVVLGDVIHTLWSLPDGDDDYGARWRMVKTLLSRACPAPDVDYSAGVCRASKGTWQRRFWVHAIRDAEDFETHRHIILTAPVEAGLVRRPVDWPHSSIHRAIARGTYDPNTNVGRDHVLVPRRKAAVPYGSVA